MSIEKIGNVAYEVSDMDAAVAFYRDTLGLTLKFQDGGRWAAFDVGGVTLALAGADQSAGPGATVSLKVGDVEAWSREAAARGLEVGPVRTGPHEQLVDVVDPDGNRLVVYSPLAG
jgi:catechol 2,3-dioxygenase-like lactoylglutathione lyase family enzyme